MSKFIKHSLGFISIDNNNFQEIKNNKLLLFVLPQELINQIMLLDLNDNNEFEKIKSILDDEKINICEKNNIYKLNNLIYKTFQYCKNNATNIKMINYNEYINLNPYKYSLYNHILIYLDSLVNYETCYYKIENIKKQRSYLDILVLNKNNKNKNIEFVDEFVDENELLEYFENNIKKQLNFDIL